MAVRFSMAENKDLSGLGEHQPVVIIVTEDESKLTRLCQQLREGGCKPFGFTSCRGAQTALAVLAPELAIVDIGLEKEYSCKDFRDELSKSAIPVAVISEDLGEALAGARNLLR